MKKYLIYVFLLVTIIGCEEVIEKRELDAVDNDDVWNSPELANLYLNKLYTFALPAFSGNANTDLSDESFGAGPGDMMYGLLEFSDGYGNFGITTYGNIRQINLLLTEIEKGSLVDEVKNRIKGQAIFLRAFIYWELVKLYGGVPMVLDLQDINSGDAIYMERNSAAECVELIVNDLDEAIALLPSTWPASDYGRITKSAAAALKGRVLLFFASPQFNPGNSQDRWEAAYLANKQAKEIAAAAGHGLYPDFEDIFLEEGNREAIFVTVYDGSRLSHGYENSVRPASVSNTASTSGNPTWEFVQAFPMKDGTPIEDHPDYNQETYWLDRDPRFYATVAYNGMEWIFPTRRDVSTRQWAYVFNNLEQPNNTPTGFYLRKNVDESIPPTETVRTGTDWIEIRFAEVLLNLAESANEAGHVEEAYTELKAIRARAGIEAGNGNYGLPAGMSVEEMRDAVMRERQIELAFENKRHWDMRRRNLFAGGLNGSRRTGIQVILDREYISGLEGISADSAIGHFETYMRDTINWENPENHNIYFNTDYKLILDDRDINYMQPKYNFYFLPQSSLEKDPKLKQTILWEGGTFDPLAP